MQLELPVIHVTSYFKALVATTVKDVSCEKCATPFVYEMIRRVVASDFSIAGINARGMQERADTGAMNALEYALAADEDPVACPSCAWFQSSMVARNERRYWHWSPWGTGYRLNPNAGTPRVIGHFPGTPTAIAISTEGHTSGSFFRRPPDIEPGNILSLRLFQGEFPSYCCNCFGAADQEEELRSKAGTFPAITIPVCDACVKAFDRRQLRYQVKYFLLFLIPSSLVCALIPFLMKFEDGWKDYLFFSLVGCVAGSMLIMRLFFYGVQRRGIPVKIEHVDGETLIGRVCFVNDDYRDRVRNHIAALPLSSELLEFIAAR
jgi:hypothetical protein